MKKPLILFFIAVIIIILAKLVYNKYCQSKEKDCIKGIYKDTFLSDDHIDS